MSLANVRTHNTQHDACVYTTFINARAMVNHGIRKAAGVRASYCTRTHALKRAQLSARRLSVGAAVDAAASRVSELAP